MNWIISGSVISSQLTGFGFVIVFVASVFVFGFVWWLLFFSCIVCLLLSCSSIVVGVFVGLVLCVLVLLLFLRVVRLF